MRDSGLDALMFLNRAVTVVQKVQADCTTGDCAEGDESLSGLMQLEPHFVRLLEKYYEEGFMDGVASGKPRA